MPRADKPTEEPTSEHTENERPERIRSFYLSQRNTLTVLKGQFGKFATISSKPIKDGEEWRNVNMNKTELIMLRHELDKILSLFEEDNDS